MQKQEDFECQTLLLYKVCCATPRSRVVKDEQPCTSDKMSCTAWNRNLQKIAQKFDASSQNAADFIFGGHKCHDSCKDSTGRKRCWGPGPNLCQVRTRVHSCPWGSFFLELFFLRERIVKALDTLEQNGFLHRVGICWNCVVTSRFFSISTYVR